MKVGKFMTKFLSRLFLLLLLLGCITAAQAEDLSVWESFQQQPERLEGHAYIELLPLMEPVKLTAAQNGEEDQYWTLDFWLCETNGVGFTIEEERLVFFDQSLTPVRDISAPADELFHFYTNQINPGDFLLFGDAYPKDERLSHIGLMITGTDANGHKMTFPMVYTLSQEFVDDYTMEELAQAPSCDHLLLMPNGGSPLLLKEEPDGLWWITELGVNNPTDDPLTIKSFDIFYFNLEGVAVAHLHMDNKAAALMCGLPTTELPSHESMLIADWCPDGDKSAMAIRLAVTDPQGEEHVAVFFRELSREVAAP